MDRKLMEIAVRQHGLFSHRQAVDAGFTRAAIRHRLQTGRWEQVAAFVYRAAGSTQTWEQRVFALVLAAGPSAAASHRSAAALLGIPGFERRGLVEVTTPRPRRHRAENAVVHRWRPFPSHHLTVIEAIVTTRVARTLCDLAGVLHPGRVERAVDNCLAMGIATPGTLQAAFFDLAGRGRKGSTAMRRILAERSEGYVPPASELEARFLDLVREAGLREPVRQFDTGDEESWIGRVDMAYPPARMLIELDSRRHHSSKLDRESDEARDARLRRAGWRMVRFTWDDLVQRPDWVLSELRGHLAATTAA